MIDLGTLDGNTSDKLNLVKTMKEMGFTDGQISQIIANASERQEKGGGAE